MTQKIVIKVSMKGQKSRSKAMKIVGGVTGVISVAFAGPDSNHIMVTGDGVDAVELTKLLRKKVGPSDLVSVCSVEYGDSYSGDRYGKVQYGGDGYNKLQYGGDGYNMVQVPVGGYYSYPYGSGHGYEYKNQHPYPYGRSHGYETYEDPSCCSFM